MKIITHFILVLSLMIAIAMSSGLSFADDNNDSTPRGHLLVQVSVQNENNFSGEVCLKGRMTNIQGQYMSTTITGHSTMMELTAGNWKIQATLPAQSGYELLQNTFEITVPDGDIFPTLDIFLSKKK